MVVEQGPVRMAFEVYKNLNARLFLVCDILLAVFVIFSIIFQNLSREKKSQNCALRALLTIFAARALFFVRDTFFSYCDTFFLHCATLFTCNIIFHYSVFFFCPSFAPGFLESLRAELMHCVHAWLNGGQAAG